MTDDPPMNAKRKAASSKETWQAMRARYTWHLRPPFDQEFDRSHWWKNEPQIDPAPAAALYELARRHPRVGELRSRLRHASWHGQELRASLVGAAKERMASHSFDDLGQEAAAIHCLCLIGLKSWPTLEGRWQEYWEDSAGSIKGIDCRHEVQKCDSTTLSALAEVLLKRACILKRKWKCTKHEEFNKLLAEGFFKNPPAAQELETALIQEVLAAHRQGHLLIAIAPNLPRKEAELLLAKSYHEQWVFKPPQQRKRCWKKWLPLISEFENEFLSRPKNQKINPQVFVHYRRTLDGIDFEASEYGGHPTRCQHILRARKYFIFDFLNMVASGKKGKPKLPITPTT
jgi:hypothetical protein